MKKIFGAVVGTIVLASALTGCSSLIEGHPVTKESSEENFLGQVYMQDFFADAPKKALVDAGHAVCDGLDTGASVENVVSLLIYGGIPPFEAGYFLGASVWAFCPEYADDIKDFVNNNNN